MYIILLIPSFIAYIDALDPQNLRKVLLKAIWDYHPDKQVKLNPNSSTQTKQIQPLSH